VAVLVVEEVGCLWDLRVVSGIAGVFSAGGDAWVLCTWGYPAIMLVSWQTLLT
jgi:hypothetical protein